MSDPQNPHADGPAASGADTVWMPADPVVRGGQQEAATESTPRANGACHAIAVAAQRAGVHEQTLRHYERLGLISPARRGTRPRSQRLYSEHDIERVVHIRQLMNDLGVNLAGVETILNMRDRMEALRREMNHELERLRQKHEDETRELRALIARLRR